MFLETVSGKAFERRVGPMTFVEMAVAAVRTRSFSTRILGRLGTMLERIPTTSSARSLGGLTVEEDWRDISPSRFSEPVVLDDPVVLSAKLVGRVVKMAVSSRRNKS